MRMRSSPRSDHAFRASRSAADFGARLDAGGSRHEPLGTLAWSPGEAARVYAERFAPLSARRPELDPTYADPPPAGERGPERERVPQESHYRGPPEDYRGPPESHYYRGPGPEPSRERQAAPSSREPSARGGASFRKLPLEDASRDYQPFPGDPTDTAVADYVRYTGRGVGSLFCRLATGRYLFGTTRVHIRLDAAGKQLEIAGPSGNYMPIEVAVARGHVR